jgi:hypothetical protein
MKTLNLYFLALLLFISCNKVPISKRRQLNLLPESTLVSMSLSNYRSFLTQNPPASASDPNTQMVQRVGTNISRSVEKFMRQEKWVTG